jgi:serine/threonine protein kinase
LGGLPLADHFDAVRKRRDGEVGHKAENYAEFEDLLLQLLQIDPKRRISPKAALEHKFLRRAGGVYQGDGASAAGSSAAAPPPTHGPQSRHHFSSHRPQGGRASA